MEKQYTFKKTMYPKTTRVSDGNERIEITEKLDGSNLGFAKVAGELWVFQRNNIYKFSDLEHVRKMMYKGLANWLEDHGEHLLENMHEGSVVFGEWIGMAHIAYPEDFGRFHMFAKANAVESETEILEVKNILYKRELFIYPFVNQEIPEYIKVVPLVATVDRYPSVEELDELYDEYSKELEHDCEGFVIQNGGNTIRKYVRLKRGVLQPHNG